MDCKLVLIKKQSKNAKEFVALCLKTDDRLAYLSLDTKTIFDVVPFISRNDLYNMKVGDVINVATVKYTDNK